MDQAETEACLGGAGRGTSREAWALGFLNFSVIPQLLHLTGSVINNATIAGLRKEQV